MTVPIPTLVTLAGSLPRFACQTQNDTKAGAARMAPIESIEANQLEGILPSGVARFTYLSTHNIPMLHTIG